MSRASAPPPSLASVFDRPVSREGERDPEGEPEVEPESAWKEEAGPSRLPRASALRVALPAGLRSRPLMARGHDESLVDPRAPIDRGVRVRVLEGPFAGKVGVVQERDRRGGARVMLGPLAVRLDVKNVVACVRGRARALLSSSHRKPLPARRVRS